MVYGRRLDCHLNIYRDIFLSHTSTASVQVEFNIPCLRVIHSGSTVEKACVGMFSFVEDSSQSEFEV
jgi:hypothetical protein